MLGARIGNFFLAALVTLSMASCGFTPVLEPGSDTAAALSDITVEAPKNQFGYLFVREMEQRVGRNLGGSKLLKYKITIRGEGIESDTDRRRFVGVIIYELIDTNTAKPIVVGSVDSFAGYSVSDGLFSSARQDAIERLIVILANQVTRELMIKLSTLP